MGTQLTVNIICGNSHVTDEDIHRAEDAALAYLADHETTARSAYAAFIRQWDYLGSDAAEAAGCSQDYGELTGLAATWIEAESAADNALTEGWADPGGASCSLTA